MTDEQLEEEIQKISESIENLPESEEPLSKEEQRRKKVLLSKKETLYKIKEAKKRNDTRDELYNTVRYGLLSSWGAKYPFLMRCVMSNFRWNPF